MSDNMKKIGTLFVMLAFVASMLIVSVPVGADDSRAIDVFVSEVTVGDAAPIVGENITITATIQTTEENATGVTVDVYYVNGSTELGPLTIDVGAEIGNVTNQTPTEVVAWWDSTDFVPDPSLVYDIKVVATNATDVNTSNDTFILEAAVDWKAPLLGVSGMVEDAANTGLIGDDLTIDVSVKNYGDAPFGDVQEVKVYKDGMGTEKGVGELNATTTALAAAASIDVPVTINTTALTAGEINFTAGLGGYDSYVLVTLEVKAAVISVKSITLDYATGVKHTGEINITGALENTGTADGTTTVTFLNGEVELDEQLLVEVVMGETTDVFYVWTTPDVLDSVEYLLWIKVGTEGKNDTVTVAPRPHTVLAISNFVLAPATLVALDDVGMTQDLTATVSVTNTGDLDAVAQTVSLELDGTEIASNATVDIAIGATVDVVFAYTATTAEADVELNFTAKLGTESDFELITVLGDIDLAEFNVTGLTIAPATEQERGLSVDITVTVKNIGDALADEIKVKVLAGTTEIGTADLVNISADGENTTAVMTWNIPASFALGDVEINATIDGYPDVFKNVTFSIIEYKKPVVTVEFAKTKKDKVANYKTEGEEGAKKTLKIKLTLTNDGTATANNVVVILKDKKGNELGNATGLTVAAGGTLDVEIPIKIKAGSSTTIDAEVTYDGVHADPYGPATAAEKSKAEVEQTPGFEAILLVGAVMVALAILSRRRK